MIRVALADDQELVRTGFAALLEAEDDIDVVGQAADAWAWLHRVLASRPLTAGPTGRLPARSAPAGVR